MHGPSTSKHGCLKDACTRCSRERREEQGLEVEYVEAATGAKDTKTDKREPKKQHQAQGKPETATTTKQAYKIC